MYGQLHHIVLHIIEHPKQLLAISLKSGDDVYLYLAAFHPADSSNLLIFLVTRRLYTTNKYNQIEDDAIETVTRLSAPRAPFRWRKGTLQAHLHSRTAEFLCSIC